MEHKHLLNPESHTLLKYIFINYTFRGPCIMMYSYNKSQRDALFLKFILVEYFFSERFTLHHQES